MIVLLDTSTADCHLMIYDNHQKIIDDVWHADRELAEKLIGYLEEQFSTIAKTWGDVTGIGFMKGPGSFTGLRIGASVCNALAADQNIPIVGVGGDDWEIAALTRLQASENDEIVLPDYGREARITTPRK